jgi:ABC-type microcin C transport system duplicated ATPase subunit YejF
LKPNSGRLLVHGEDVTDLSDKEFGKYRRQLQLIFQDPYASLDPRLCVRDLIAEPLKTWHVCRTKEELTRRVLELMEDVGVPGEYLYRYPHQFSGGQRQRIALARALLRDYPVIMLDEATSALDNETQATIRDAIENMHGKRTVVMIAHRLSTIVNCERLFYLENGKVLASGTHAELLERCPEYRRLYSEEASA